MNAKFDLFFDIKLENMNGKELAKHLTQNNNQNIKFTFAQYVDDKCEFYVEGSSRVKVDEGLTELGFDKGSKFYEQV